MENFKLKQIKNVDYIIKINNEYYRDKIGYETALMNNKSRINFQKGIGYLQGLYLQNENNENIGFIIYQITNNTNIHNKYELSLYLADIYIDEKYQNQGLGNQLMNSSIIIDYMNSKFDYDNIQIYSTIETTNEESLKLHLKNGFKIYDIQKDEYTIKGEKLDGYLLYKNYKGIDNFEKINKQNDLNENIKKSLNIVEKNTKSTLKIGSYKVNLFENPENVRKFKYIDKLIYKADDNLKYQVIKMYENNDFNEFKKEVKIFVEDLKSSTETIKENFKDFTEVTYDNGLAKIKLYNSDYITFHPFTNINDIIEEFNNINEKNKSSQEINIDR